jgi:hypothetical protein
VNFVHNKNPWVSISQSISCDQFYAFAKGPGRSNTQADYNKRAPHMVDALRSQDSPYSLSFSQDCMEGRLAPFADLAVEPLAVPSDRSVVHVTDELNRYIALIEHPYGRLNRVIAQMAGLLILGQASNGFSTYAQLANTPEQALIETLELLAHLKVPVTVAVHFKHLSLAASNLLHLSRALHHNITNATAFKTRAPEWLSELNKANALLRCIAIPHAGLMPVDLQNTCFCCSQQ